MKALFDTLTIIFLAAMTVFFWLWFWVAVNGEGDAIGGLPIWIPSMLGFMSLALAIGQLLGRWRGTAVADSAVITTPPADTTREVERARPGHFTVHHGKRYKATIALSFFEQVASNEMIGGMLQKAGFADVQVTGDGGTRHAEAVWPGSDSTAALPSQVVAATEVA